MADVIKKSKRKIDLIIVHLSAITEGRDFRADG